MRVDVTLFMDEKVRPRQLAIGADERHSVSAGRSGSGSARSTKVRYESAPKRPRKCSLPTLGVRLKPPEMSVSERAFLRHLADGLTVEQAGEIEGLSARASHGRLRRLCIALKAWTPTHAVATALRFGLID